jgi:MraZ protein
MLLGEFRCRTDSGGRLTVPSIFRSELVDGATVTRGIERCLWIYPAVGWQELGEKVRQLPITSQPGRAFARLIFSGAAVCVPDEAGQLLLPDNLRQYARIGDEAVLVGVLSHVEVWSPESWQESKSSFVAEGVVLAEELSGFGI